MQRSAQNLANIYRQNSSVRFRAEEKIGACFIAEAPVLNGTCYIQRQVELLDNLYFKWNNDLPTCVVCLNYNAWGSSGLIESTNLLKQLCQRSIYAIFTNSVWCNKQEIHIIPRWTLSVNYNFTTTPTDVPVALEIRGKWFRMQLTTPELNGRPGCVPCYLYKWLLKFWEYENNDFANVTRASFL